MRSSFSCSKLGFDLLQRGNLSNTNEPYWCDWINANVSGSPRQWGEGSAVVWRDGVKYWGQFAKSCDNHISIITILESTTFCKYKSLECSRLILPTLYATRWRHTLVAANWSGGRWRADSFLHQDGGCELQCTMGQAQCKMGKRKMSSMPLILRRTVTFTF